MVGIIDYGSGNLRSVYNAFRYLGQDVKVCEGPDELKDTDRIVLPGVGASKDAMDGLIRRDMVGSILDCIEKACLFSVYAWGCNCFFQKVPKREDVTVWG